MQISFSTPTCYGMPPAIGKVLMDRADSLWVAKALKGKLGAVIVNGASTNERLERCKDNVNAFFDSYGMISIRNAPCIGGSEEYGDQRFPRELDEDIKNQLGDFARDISHIGKKLLRGNS